MILVLLGTQNNSFHRLLEEIEKLITKKVIKEEVIVQAGHTKFNSKHMKIFDLISSDEFEKLIKKSNLIITHGGVGSILTSIKNNKKVIAVPRLKEYNEHVNNHQKDIIESFNKKHYIVGINKVSELENALLDIKNFKPKKYIENNNKIIKIIEDFIDNN